MISINTELIKLLYIASKPEDKILYKIPLIGRSIKKKDNVDSLLFKRLMFELIKREVIKDTITQETYSQMKEFVNNFCEEYGYCTKVNWSDILNNNCKEGYYVRKIRN